MEGGLAGAFEGLEVQLIVPDLWQQDAIRKLREGVDVILSAPTGSGKTFIFEHLAESGKSHHSGRQAVYTVPTRALANDKWREWTARGWDVGIATGDLAENLKAPILVATLETQRERLLSGDGPGLLIIDEYQMIGDRQRGLNYELAIALAPPETQLLLMSGSVANPGKVRDWMIRLGRNAEVVETKERAVPQEEIPIEAMPRVAPRKYQNFWERLAIGVLLSEYGPLLIFAPHRKAAEKIAWKIAGAMPEDDPVKLGGKQLEQLASADLRRLLKKRVAFHHSGMSFGERSAIVEPLAKAGQLRVVVATMGLAAGINFSVRSVFIGETSYQDGPYQRRIRGDELLQMYGRAGRRGLDKRGYILTARTSPGLGDARPLELRRKNETDWPTLIRRMHHASLAGKSPFESARELRNRLFSVQSVPLGFQRSTVESPDQNDSTLFNLKPTRREILNSKGEWETYDSARRIEAPLGEGWRFVKGRCRPAESDSEYISTLLPPSARLTRLDEKGSGPKRYGMELAAASLVGEDQFRISKAARKRLGESGGPVLYSLDEAKSFFPELFETIMAPGSFERVSLRGSTLYLSAGFQDHQVSAYLDSHGQSIMEPEERKVVVESETHYIDETSGDSFNPAPGSPAYAWRKLGLIDDGGVPTTRGVIFSLFQGGEGLAVAAMLEDTGYPLEEGIRHLANLRAGYRFEIDHASGPREAVDSAGSERLALTCREAFGPVDYEGYLSLGLPAGYGEGAAEVIAMREEGRLYQLFAREGGHLEFGPGDVERAYIEWLSLLRHVHFAPQFENARWEELKDLAKSELDRHERKSPLSDFPALPTTTLQQPPKNRIHFSSIR
ncbi:DEAD/DEAH box helicase [Verrucomicrobiales bacterium BCK34]|nr:DEAD/DEAH box helicase [Verrucomicrobiales bacterium BCK34]